MKTNPNSWNIQHSGMSSILGSPAFWKKRSAKPLLLVNVFPIGDGVVYV